MSRVENKLQFDKWAEHYGLTPQERDETWTVMLRSGMEPSDPNSYFLIATTVQQRLFKAMDEVPARIEATARKVVGPISEAATKQAEANLSKMAVDAGKEVATVAERVMQDAIATRAFTVKFAVWIGALVSFAIILAVGFWIGTGVGRVDGMGADVAVRAWAGRTDFNTIKRVLAYNPNLNNTIGKECRTGWTTQTTAGGARACSMTLWLDTPPSAGEVVNQGKYTLGSFYSMGSSFLNRFHPMTILGMGLVAGWLVPRIAGWVVHGSRKGKSRMA